MALAVAHLNGGQRGSRWAPLAMAIGRRRFPEGKQKQNKKNKFKSCTVELRTLKSRKERADCDKSALARVATPYKGALLRLNPAPLVRDGVTFTLAVISSSSGGANKQKKKGK